MSMPNDKEVPMPKNDKEAVIAVLADELPHTARIMNPPSITEEIIFGKNNTPDDDEVPPQEVYDRYEEAIEELVIDGLVQWGEAMGFKVCGLTIAYQDRLKAQVLRYLEQAAKRE